MNNASVASFLAEGCGRCERFRTPACKVHPWAETLRGLRAILRETELVEEMKWGFPCYTLGGKNVALLAVSGEFCAISFFQGAVLEDEAGVLVAPGLNSRFARYMKFHSVAELEERRELALRYVLRAIAAERAGVRVAAREGEDGAPAELQERLDCDDRLRVAFDGLTPGRRRSHVLYIGGAKSEEARRRRVERCVPKILAGRGYHER